MKFIAHINVMPLKELLDPQGKAVNTSLHNLGLTNLHDVRIGKHITLHVDAPTKDEADKHVRDACKRLLANQVMEAFDFTLTEA